MSTEADTMRGAAEGGMTGGVMGAILGGVYSLMRSLGSGPGPTVRFQDLGPLGQRLVRGWAARGGIQNFGGQSMMPPTGGTPPINPGGYPFPVPRGETVRGPFRNPWDPYVGLFEILVRTGKRLWKKIPKGSARVAARRALPGVVGVGIYVGGVLWDFLPDWPEGASSEEIAKRRTAQGCKRHGDGWICPPGRGRPSPGAQPPMRSPPESPTALPGGAPVPGSTPAPVVTSGPIIRTVPPEPKWKKYLELATPFLPLAALLIPSGKKERGVTTNITIPSSSQLPFSRDLTAFYSRPASLPGSGTGSQRCQCGPKRKRKPKDKRRICYRGTYTETPTGLIKRRGKRVSCQRSRKRRRS